MNPPVTPAHLESPSGLAAILTPVVELLSAEASRPLTPPEFFRRCVAILREQLQLSAAAVWMLEGLGSFRVFAQSGLDDVCPSGDQAAVTRNRDILLQAITQSHVGSFEFVSPASPECNCVLILPVTRHGECVTVIELFGRDLQLHPISDDDVTAANALIAAIARYLEGAEQQSDEVASPESLSVFQSFTESLHRSLEPRQTARSAVNDLVPLLQIDRACLLKRSGHRWKLEAVSGQPSINRRTRHVRSLETLTRRVMSCDRTLEYHGSGEQFPPKIADVLAPYLDESHCRMLQIIPLRVPSSSDDPSRGETERRAHWALVLEQYRGSQPSRELQSHRDSACRQTAIALNNAERFSRQPFRWLFGGSTVTTGPGTYVRSFKLLAISLFLLAATAALFLVDAPYRVEATGRLLPSIQRRVFASTMGTVDKVLVEEGAVVTAGTVLAQIDDPELSTRLLELQSAITSTSKELHGLRSEWLVVKQSSSRLEQLQLQTRIEQTRISLEGLHEQRRQLEVLLEGLQIRCPIDGVVVLSHPVNELQGKPVNRGEVLFEIHDPDSEWVVEMEFSDHRIGHIQAAQNAKGPSPLSVSYLLKSDPTLSYSGHLTSVADHTSAGHAGGSVVSAVVSLDGPTLPPRHFGADVLAKIDCGHRRLGYVLFGDAIEFVRRVCWF